MVFVVFVLDIINRCNDIGLNVAVITRYIGSANRAMWTKLCIVSGKKAVTENLFLHACNPDKNVGVHADIPHVIINVRNHLVNGQIFA